MPLRDASSRSRIGHTGDVPIGRQKLDRTPQETAGISSDQTHTYAYLGRFMPRTMDWAYSRTSFGVQTKFQDLSQAANLSAPPSFNANATSLEQFQLRVLHGIAGGP